MTNTIANHNEYGVYGEDAGLSISALSALTRGYVWTHNVLAGGNGTYPMPTWQPSMAAHRAQFGPNYTLTPTSTYRNAGSDGQDLGALMTTPIGTPATPQNFRVIR